MKTVIILFLLYGLSLNAKSQAMDSFFEGTRSDKWIADTLFSLSRKHFRNSRFDSAEYLLTKGFVFASKTGNDELVARYMTEQSQLLFFRKQFNEGLALLKQSYPHVMKAHSNELYKKYLLSNGRFFENLHRNDSALYYYHLCEIHNNENNPYDNWIVYYNMAQMFKRADAFAESEKYFVKAYNITKPVGIRVDHITVLIEYADLYYLQGKPEKFASVMDEQQKMMQQVKRDFSKNPVHNMFFYARKKESLEKKVQFMENVKTELAKTGRLEKITDANNYIAAFYEEANMPQKALVPVEENRKIFEKNNDLINLFFCTKTAYRLLKKAGMTTDAIAEADRLLLLKDSIIALQQRETVMDLDAKYESEKKQKEILFLNTENLLNEKEIALLNTENRLKSFKLLRETDLKMNLLMENQLKDSIVKSQAENYRLVRSENDLKTIQLANEQLLKAAATRENISKENKLVREKKIRWQLTSALALLMVCGLTIFILYGKQKSKARIIQKQSEDLQVLMKEIHHRVKNNLQIISSLLDLQSLSIKDKHAAGAVREGKMRVQSMAIIHQNLYNEGNIKGIVMKDYINKLVENLFHSYNIQDDKIKLVTDIDHLNLDVDTVIPLGLIVNELISNSLKYAFKQTGEGEVSVSLKENSKQLQLTVKDNGCGFPSNMNKPQMNSFGFNLINAFAQKLKAKLDIYNDGGACVSMNITRYKPA